MTKLQTANEGRFKPAAWLIPAQNLQINLLKSMAYWKSRDGPMGWDALRLLGHGLDHGQSQVK